MWTTRIPHVNRTRHDRWAYRALHWIFITSTVTTKCLSRVCEVVSFYDKKNSLATLKLEKPAWGRNFNEMVINEIFKTFHRNNTQAHNEGLGPCTVRSPYFFRKKFLLWDGGGEEYCEYRIKAHITLIYNSASLFLQKIKNNPRWLFHVTWLRHSLTHRGRRDTVLSCEQSVQLHRFWIRFYYEVIRKS